MAALPKTPSVPGIASRSITSWRAIALHYGLPTAMLVALAVYHVAIVEQKDEELRRLNEARIAEVSRCVHLLGELKR